MSDSLRPHGLYPRRLLHPWDFPGKSTGVGKLKDLAPQKLFFKFHQSVSTTRNLPWFNHHHSKERLVKMNFSLNFPSRTTKVEFSPIFGFSQNRNRAQAINSHRFSYSISSPTSDSIKIYTALISFVKKHTEPLRFFP